MGEGTCELVSANGSAFVVALVEQFSDFEERLDLQASIANAAKYLEGLLLGVERFLTLAQFGINSCLTIKSRSLTIRIVGLFKQRQRTLIVINRLFILADSGVDKSDPGENPCLLHEVAAAFDHRHRAIEQIERVLTRPDTRMQPPHRG